MRVSRVTVLMLLTALLSCIYGPSGQGDEVNSAPKASEPLQGQVNTVDLELGDIHDILLDIKRAKVAGAHLYEEVSRNPITYYNFANVMGPVMLTIPEPMFDTSEVLPARKKYVDLYMSEITPLISYIKTDFSAVQKAASQLKFSAKAEEKFTQYLKECSTELDTVSQCGAQLQQLTPAPPYDNLAVAKGASALHKELRKLEKLTKDLGHEVKESKK